MQDFTDVSLKTCIERDLKRVASVGEKVIRDMYKEFLLKIETYDENKELPKAIIVDIDGTLAKMSGRSPFDWGRVKEDVCNSIVKGIVNNYNQTVFIFSGRDSVCRQETIEWLADNDVKYHKLFMREEGVNEEDQCKCIHYF